MENQKKRTKKLETTSEQKFPWGDEHTVVFKSIKNAAAIISKVHYYDAIKNTMIICNSSHNGLGATLEQ